MIMLDVREMQQPNGNQKYSECLHVTCVGRVCHVSVYACDRNANFRSSEPIKHISRATYETDVQEEVDDMLVDLNEIIHVCRCC